jgi:Guanosine polyphosphate pyrophosphohydrolases/synthetases
MGYKLQNGDQLQITTKKNQKPNESWLKMVVTGKARSKIRSAMKEERRKQGEIGKETLMRKLKNIKVDFEENVDTLVKFFDFNSRVDLYFEIAMEQLNIQQELKNFKIENNKLVEIQVEEKVIEKEAPVSRRKSKNIPQPKLLIGGESASNYQYHLANCCNPVQGDDVFAYLTVSAGLKIHRTNCPNSTNLMANYGYRIMKAEWVISTKTSFVADLLITGIDDGPGVIERLSHSISSELGLNIRSFSIAGEEGYFEGKVSLLVANKDQLNVAIRGLQNLDGVSTVTRIGH